MESIRGVPVQRAEMLASMSGGSVARALEMDDSGFLDLREHVLTVLRDPGAVGIAGIVEMSAALSSDKKRAADAIEIAVTWIRDQVMTMMGGDAFSCPQGDPPGEVSAATCPFTERELLSVYDELLKASALIEADINANRNLVVDVMLLRTARILAGPTFGVTRGNR